MSDKFTTDGGTDPDFERREGHDTFLHEARKADQAQIRDLATEVERLQGLYQAQTENYHEENEARAAAEAESERLRAEIEGGWLALGFRRNPQHDVRIADGINRLRAMHAERLSEDDDE